MDIYCVKEIRVGRRGSEDVSDDKGASISVITGANVVLELRAISSVRFGLVQAWG